MVVAPGQLVMVEVALDFVHAVLPESAHFRMVVGAHAVRTGWVVLAQCRKWLGGNCFVVLHWDH